MESTSSREELARCGWMWRVSWSARSWSGDLLGMKLQILKKKNAICETQRKFVSGDPILGHFLVECKDGIEGNSEDSSTER
jgi:hypothetical protein